MQQDLAPCHTSKLVKKGFTDHGIQVLPWPGNSPDLNPIEKIWPILKAKVKKQNVRTRQDIMPAVIKIWNKSDELNEICKALVHSMPRRVQACIDARAGPICY